jgi:hypothetical protein
MKIFSTLFFVVAVSFGGYAQQTASISKDSVKVECSVQFFTYDDDYGDQHIKEPAINLILTVTNNGTKPIPDLGVSNRSEYVNLYIDGKNANPVSMYNGTEAIGPHLIQKNGKDSYAWWIFEKEAYGATFTVQWEYMGVLSNKMKVTVAGRTAVEVK